MTVANTALTPLAGAVARESRRPVLRDYQAQLKADVQAAWVSGSTNVAAVLPTGGGKTQILADIVSEHNGPACVIAHRQELVGQISLALATFGVRHRIVGPKKVIEFCVRQQMEKLGVSFYDANARDAVAGVDTLVSPKRAGQLKHWAEGVTLWVQDECFPAGTLIDGKPIEQVRAGDYVTAFCEQTHRYEKRRVVRRFENPMPERMVRIETRSHHVVTCTQGHPFWTRRGWINAANLNTDDEVLLHESSMQLVRASGPRDNGVAEIPLPQNGSHLLPSRLWLCASRLLSKTEKTGRGASRVLGMRSRRFGQRLAVATLERDRAGVLLQDMRKRVSSAPLQRDDGGNQSPLRIRTNASAQPNAQCRYAETGKRYAKTDRAPAASARRQWAPGDRSRDRFTQRTGKLRLRSAACGTHGAQQPMAASLQNRLRSPGTENCSRGRRGEPWRPRQAGAGRAERRISAWCRLDSVQVLKRGDTEFPEGSCVYNIEVEGLHTYVANGVTVHNCHHILRKNKWGRAADMFPNARGLGVTATFERADGKGLGRCADGVMDAIVEGPTQRDLINLGWLTDYRIYAPPSDLHMDDKTDIGSTGDYSQPKMAKKAKESHIVGDVVKHYRRLAAGKRGVTFATDVETATDIANQYHDAGVPAQCISAKTQDAVRTDAVRRLADADLLQLTNVDLFGEGFDLPAIDVVSLARPTASFGLFVQQIGRALRPIYAEGMPLDTPEQRKAAIAAGPKPYATVIDHVGNVQRHAVARECPETGRMIIDVCFRQWSLEGREKRSSGEADDAIPLTVCLNPTGGPDGGLCGLPYERVKPRCPWCGFKPEPQSRSGPEWVDGDLTELDPSALQQIIAAGDPETKIPYGASPVVAMSLEKKARERRQAQDELRDVIAWWAAYQRARGRSDAESYRRFYHLFGIDVATARTLRRKEAQELADRVSLKLTEYLGWT